MNNLVVSAGLEVREVSSFRSLPEKELSLVVIAELSDIEPDDCTKLALCTKLVKLCIRGCTKQTASLLFSTEFDLGETLTNLDLGSSLVQLQEFQVTGLCGCIALIMNIQLMICNRLLVARVYSRG
jgi:hypothetical protein